MKIVILILLFSGNALALEPKIVHKKEKANKPIKRKVASLYGPRPIASGATTEVHFFSQVVQGITYHCFFTDSTFSDNRTPGQLSCFKK